MPMSFVTKNPPITSYYIAVASFIFGYNETTIHALFLLPAIAVAIGTYLFAQRYCKHPLFASFAGILTPVFLVSSLTVMSDMLMLAFWIFAVYFWIKGLENKNSIALYTRRFVHFFCSINKILWDNVDSHFFFSIHSIENDESDINFYIFLSLYHSRIIPMVDRNLYGRGLLSDAAEFAMYRKSEIGNSIGSKIFVNSLL